MFLGMGFEVSKVHAWSSLSVQSVSQSIHLSVSPFCFLSSYLDWVLNRLYWDHLWGVLGYRQNFMASLWPINEWALQGLAPKH